ncbi:hypothetical protein, partial [Escherichia coli]|uniref:hypothetical protein n=1 Tax=Escherichia coli TaxID=562 RepID=UPI001F04DA69
TTYLVDTTLSNSSDSDQTVQAVRLPMLTLGEIFNDCFYVQLLLSVHKLNDIIHIINGRDILHETYPFN